MWQFRTVDVCSQTLGTVFRRRPLRGALRPIFQALQNF